MNISERIAFIKHIADKLSNESYSIIDLTLSQFGLETFDNWN